MSRSSGPRGAQQCGTTHDDGAATTRAPRRPKELAAPQARERAHRSLEEFKSSHDAEGGASPIPLVRLGVDETGSDRVVNVSAKRLVGFSEEEIAALAAGARETIEDAGI